MKKRILSILMCIAMIFTVVYNPMVVEKASAASWYGNDYRFWNQCQSAYSEVKDVGCLIVAQRKLLFEAGVNTNVSYTPDNWYSWLCSHGKLANPPYDLRMLDHGAPSQYAKEQGHNLQLLGTDWATSNDQIWYNINAGYYTILSVNNGGHWVMVDNATSKKTGTIHVYESWSGSKECDYVVNYQSTYGYCSKMIVYKGDGRVNVTPDGNAQSGYVNLGDKFNASIFRTDEWVTLLSDTTTLGTGGRHARSVWTFERQSNGAYIITSWYDGKVLDVYGAEKSDGTKVWTCDRWVDSSGSNAAQEWYIYKVGDGYRFVPRLVPNKAMTCVHDSYGPKTPMNLQAWINRGSQIFSVYKQTEVFPTGISTSNKTINEGESATLSYAISPSNTNSKYVGATFSSSNTNVVTVDENGVITGVAPGTATVTVTMAFNERKTAKATITVKEVIVDNPEEDGDGNHVEHKWDSGTIVTSPTCTSTGVKRYICQVCDEWKTETLKKLAHNIVTDAAVAATCTSTGLTEGKHCINCDYKVEQQLIPKSKHQYYEIEGYEPTCQEPGLKCMECRICGDEQSVVLDIVDHEGCGDWYIDTKASSKYSGWKYDYCQYCWMELDRVEIPKIGQVKLSTTTYTYSGKAKNPTVKVYDVNGNLISSKNYTVKKQTKRINVGKHTYKITFKNEYTGTKIVSFKINPKATYLTQKPTASKRAFTAKWKKVSKQVTGYQIQYATNSKFTKGKKTVTVKSYKTTSKKITKLTAKKTYYVRVRTYKTVSGVKYYSSWSNYKTVKTR